MPIKRTCTSDLLMIFLIFDIDNAFVIFMPSAGMLKDVIIVYKCTITRPFSNVKSALT